MCLQSVLYAGLISIYSRVLYSFFLVPSIILPDNGSIYLFQISSHFISGNIRYQVGYKKSTSGKSLVWLKILKTLLWQIPGKYRKHNSQNMTIRTKMETLVWENQYIMMLTSTVGSHKSRWLGTKYGKILSIVIKCIHPTPLQKAEYKINLKQTTADMNSEFSFS